MIHHCEYAIIESQIEKMKFLLILENPMMYLYQLLNNYSEKSVVMYVKSLTSSHGYHEEEAGNMVISG